MNNDKGRLNFAVSLDNSALRAGASESRRILRGISDSAVREGERIDESFKSLGKTIAGAFAVDQMRSFVAQIVKVRGEFQQLEISFTTMLGSASQAKLLMDQLVKTAATTPFNLKDIGQAAKQLIAYGVAADEVNGLLVRLGDIASGLSIPLGDLVYLYGTTMVQGRLYTQDLNQFLGRGIPLMEELAKQFGVAESQVKQLVEEGKVGFQQVQKAIENLTSEGSKFGGGMAAQAKSINGQISNIEDAIDAMLNEIGKQQEGVINASLGLTSNLIENWRTVGNVLLTVISVYGSYKAAVIAVAAAHKLMNIWGTVQAFLSLATTVRSAKDVMLLFNLACKANPLGLVLSALAAATSAFYLFKQATTSATDALEAEVSEAETFNKRVAESSSKAIASYKQMQEEYKNCKREHERSQWIKDNQQRFNELGISVSGVNDAENIFVRNTATMLKALRQRAEAAAWQAKIEDAYAQRVEREMELEARIEAIKAGSKSTSTTHTTANGMERIDRNGSWVYTEAGAKKAKEELKRQFANDPVLMALDEKINTYTSKMASLSDSFKILFNQSSKQNLTKEEENEEKRKAKERQKIADETAQRTKTIEEYGRKVSESVAQAELEIRQSRINGMEDGLEKSLAQVDLNYDRLMAENASREKAMIEELKDNATLEWQNDNPRASKEDQIKYRSSLVFDRSDLSAGQRSMLEAYERIANEIKVKGNQEALKDMLDDVRSYEERRMEITKEYDRKRRSLYTTDGQGNSVLREGVSMDNVEELNRQEREALQAVDEQFAQREESYKAWCDRIANMTLTQLESVLKKAETELEKAKANGDTGSKLAAAEAKVTEAQKRLAEARAKDALSPGERTLEEWKDLYETLNECAGTFKELGDAIGGTVGEAISAAGGIATSTTSMINGIVQLVQMSSVGISATASTAAKAMQVVERASVILTVISAAMQVATAIANLFNNDKEKQKEIDALQERIDQLQWELNNSSVVTLQESQGKALRIVNEQLQQTRREILANAYATKDFNLAWNTLYGNARTNNELLTKSADKLATAYANVAYTADKALGAQRYDEAREQLENLSKQQILIQEQIRQEEDKKKTDSGKISDWERQIEELGQQAVEIINGMVEDIIGGSSSDIATELADAFFEAFQAGEDYAEAWGDKVNDIVADVIKRMLVSKYLEEPLGDIFDKYKSKWFKDGQFVGLQAVIDSMSGFAADLNAVGNDFAQIWEALPDSVRGMFNVAEQVTEEVTAAREGATKGIATASQESVDELSGRATAIQGHTYSIAENTRLLLSSVNMILSSVLNIERHTETMADEATEMRKQVKEVKESVNDIVTKGIKLK